jgi:hypothetical protein
VSHPGNHGGFGPLFHWDSLGSSHGSAADWSCVFRHGTSELLSQFGVVGMEVEKRHDSAEEVLYVCSLGVFSTASIGRFSLGVSVRGSFHFKFMPNSINRVR